MRLDKVIKEESLRSHLADIVGFNLMKYVAEMLNGLRVLIETVVVISPLK